MTNFNDMMIYLWGRFRILSFQSFLVIAYSGLAYLAFIAGNIGWRIHSHSVSLLIYY